MADHLKHTYSEFGRCLSLTQRALAGETNLRGIAVPSDAKRLLSHIVDHQAQVQLQLLPELFWTSTSLAIQSHGRVHFCKLKWSRLSRQCENVGSILRL